MSSSLGHMLLVELIVIVFVRKYRQGIGTTVSQNGRCMLYLYNHCTVLYNI